MLGPDEVVDNVRAAGVAATVAEPPLAYVTVDQGGRVVDAAVAAGRAVYEPAAAAATSSTDTLVILVLELQLGTIAL